MSAINLSSNKINIVKVSDGQNGQSGFTQVLLYLYQRASSAPSRPTTSSYNPNNGTLIANGNWVSSISSTTGTNPCYVTTVFLSIPAGTTQAISIDTNQWSNPVVLVQNGQDGTSVSISSIKYAAGTSGTSHSGLTFDTSIPSVPQGGWLWVETTYSNGSQAYSCSYMGTDGEDGNSVTVTSTVKVGKTTTVTLTNSDGTTQTFTIDDGEDGEDGQPGAPGQDGTPSYVHFAWANSADGTTDFSTSVSSGKSYMGVYTDSTQQDSQTPSDYSWTKIVGRGVQSVIEYYKANNSSSVAPTGDWGTSVLTPTEQLPYVWNYEVVNYTDGTTSSTNKHVVAMYGASGAAGRGINNIVDQYAKSSTTTAPEDRFFDTTIPTLDETNKYLWNREEITYTDNTVEYTSKRIIGMYSKDGTSVTVSNTYYGTSNSSSTQPSSWTQGSPTNIQKGVWLWIKTVFSDTNEAITCSYTGNDGQNGQDGTSVSIYSQSIAYQASDSGSNIPSGTWSSTVAGAGAQPGDYLWTRTIVNYTMNGTTVSSTTTSYSVSRIGSDGAQGAQGPQGPAGQDGQDGQDGTSVSILNQEIKYQASNSGDTTPTGTWSSTVAGAGAQAGQFLWTRTTVNYTTDGSTISNSTVSYSVSRIGTNGTNGQDGVNSAILYIYQRKSGTAPTAPRYDVVYVFADGDYTQETKINLSPWQTTIPTNDGNPCYVATAAAISSSDRDTILGTDAGQNCDWTVSQLVANGTNGTNGTSITGVVEQYAINNSNTTPPIESSSDWGTSQISPTSTNKYLWNREVISYSDGNSVITTPHIASMYTQDGAAGRGISSIENKYAINNNSGTAPTTWENSPMAPTSSNPYLWNQEIITYTSGNPLTTTTTRVIGTYSEDGYNQATVYVYKRSSTPLDSSTYTPTATKYTFSTKQLTGLTSGWNQDMPPAGDDPCYISCAVVVSRTDEATPITFATPARLVANGQDGQDGQDGADGYNYIKLDYYQRSVLAPASLTGTYSYNFSTQVLSPSISASTGWQTTIPDGNDPCWVTSIIFYDNDTSATSTFNTPVKLAQNGADGKDANQYTIRTIAEEILKFPNSNEWENKKYLFSISNFQMVGFNSKNQVPIENAEYTLVPNLTAEEFNSNKTYYYTKNQSGEFVQCTNSDVFNSSTDYYYKSLLYCVLDIEIEGYKFKELFKPDDGNNLIYSRYVYTQGSDSSNYYFSIINFYNDLLDNTLSNNFSDKKYQSVIITAADFNGHQTDYYTYNEVQEEYVQCQSGDTFDSTKTYYVDYSNEIINTFLDCFENVNGFDFRIYGQVIDLDGNASNIEKFISVKNGLNSEMLDFSVTAGSVYAAIQGKKLTFDGEGLTVLNNGFKIEVGEENQDKTTIFSVDPLSQQLIMNGSGTFTGTINADSGSFKGSIDAATGTIGGFIINDNSIVSKTQKLQLYSQMDLDLGVIEQGTISSITYANISSSSRVRTQGYISVLPGHSYIFTVDDNYEIIGIDETTFNSHKDYYYTFNNIQNIYEQCDDSSVFNSQTKYYIARQLLIRGYSDTLPETHVPQAYVGFTNFPFTYEVPENTNYIRLAIKKSNNSNMTPNEIQNLQGYEDISLINAGNIHIGDGGVVDGYLRIGNLSLMNPSKTDENIVMSLDVPGEEKPYFKLTNEGYIEGQNWSIKKETGNPYVVARFGKLVAEDGQFSGVIYASDGSFSGAITASTINATTLNTVNFVTENTRSMGGSFIFKPTFQIVDFEDKSNNTLEFELENTEDYFNFDSFETEDEVELSGESISFNNGSNVKEIKSFELELEPEQNLNGYDHPWPAGGGKNKLPLIDGTYAIANTGATAVIDNGKITVSGTTTLSGGRTVRLSEYFTLSAGDYIISPAQNTSPYIRIYLNKKSDDTSLGYSKGTAITLTAETEVYCGITVESGQTYSNVEFYPQVESGTTATSYAPYSNICPITGWTGANVYRTGENLHDDQTDTVGYYINASGNITQGTGYRYTALIPVGVGATYIFSGMSTTPYNYFRRVHGYDANGEWVSQISFEGVSDIRNFIIPAVIPQNISYVRLSLREADENIAFALGDTYSADWTSTAGTVYGGTLDVVSGKLTVTHAILDMGSVDYTMNTMHKFAAFFPTGTNAIIDFTETSEVAPIMCSAYKVGAYNNVWETTTDGICVYRVGTGDEKFGVIDHNYSDITTFKTSVTGQKIVYPLKTAKTYTLTPQEIEFLTGQNNIWANTGTIQLIYDTRQVIVTLSGTDSSTSLTPLSNVRFGKISSIANINENKVQVKFTNEDYQILNNPNLLDNYQTLTLFGESYNDLIIGINSDNNSAGNILPPRALVMRSFTNSFNEEESGIINYNTKLLLGDLSSLVNQDSSYKYLSGYGLYADNVFLHGSLMTRNGEGSFAGINTSKNYDFNYAEWGGSNENIYLNEKIIFWGGANDLSDESIRRSPFIVTDKGSIFANRGEFKGTVITDSTIANSIIKTPIIYGIGNDPSLKIYNTYNESGGIGFYKTTNDTIGDLDDKQTLNISELGFTHYINDNDNDKAFKFIEFADGSNSVRFYGYSLTAYDTNLDGTINNSSYTVYGNKNIENGTTSIKIDKDTGVELNYNDNRKITIDNQGIFNTGGSVTNEGATIFQGVGTDSNKQIKHTINSNGYYCVYVVR